MKPALAVFDAGIDQLIVFLDRTEQERELITLLNERKDMLPQAEATMLNSLIATSTHARQYIYAVAVVSLYGLLERLIDSLICGYVTHLGEYGAPYECLPEVIRNNHLRFSLLLADALQKDRFRTEATQEQLVANLHSCLSGSSTYKLNGSAFALHRGNVNLGRINDMLTGIGAQHHMRRVVRTGTMSTFLRKLDPERDAAVLGDADLQAVLEPIDDLVERRNDISHGVIQADEIQSVELLRERCEFVRAYGSGLCEVLLQEVLKFSSEIGVAQALGKPIHVYDNAVVCFEESCQIAVGDLMFAVTADALEPVRYSSVISLQINRVNQQNINAEVPVKFGAKVAFHANGNHQYFSLPAGKF